MANGYNAGDLNITIQTISTETIKSLDAVIERLSLIDKGLGTMSGFARGGKPFIRKSTSGSHTEKTYSVDKKGREYLTLQKDIQKAEKSLRTITTQFDKHGKVLKKTTVDVDKYGNKITKIFGGYSKGTSKGGIFGFAKLGVSLHLMRRLGRFMGDLVQAGSDYNETLNLWQVAMRNNLDVADQFINKMQKAYGISTKTLMNAQAIFKNMIGSLGQISDATAYALSEALVQMSADFASLYNVTIESAFQKMQAMLAGQVRPIRSAGLDMTETTLFMFYQQLGGTKTMRQLNRTEKQLLSILAVYQQMGSAGALGDMSKTLNQFANQSRMMTEYWVELKTWTGLVLKDLIDQSGALIYINAALITMTEVVKAIAKSRGLGDENFLTGMFETAEATNDAVDELQGKLLDFDKFRSLEGATASPLAIDEKLLQAISGYSSKIDQAENAAQKLADTWLTFWLNDDGTLTQNAKDFLEAVKSIGTALGILVSIKLGTWVITAAKAFGAFAIAKAPLAILLLSVVELIEAIKNGDEGMALFYGSIVLVSGAFIILNTKIGQTIALKVANWFSDMSKHAFAAAQKIGLVNIAFAAMGIAILGAGLNEFISNFDKLSNKAKVWIPILAGLAGVITAIAAGLTFMKGNWVGAIGLGAMVAGAGLMVGTQLSVPNYEMGASDIDSGTVFRAGEFGKTEAVYTGSNGKTNVANVQQMKAAFYQALVEYGRTSNADGRPIEVYLDGERVYQNTTAHAKRRGNTWSKV